jgi:hypothetical protein
LLILLEAGKSMDPSINDPGAMIWYLTDLFSMLKNFGFRMYDFGFIQDSRLKIHKLQRFHDLVFAAVLIDFKFSDPGK